MAAKKKFKIRQGETLSYSFQVAGKPVGWKTGDPYTPTDLTGCLVWGQIRKTPKPTDIPVDLLVIVDDPLTGAVTFKLTDEASSLLVLSLTDFDTGTIFKGGLRLTYANGDSLDLLDIEIEVFPSPIKVV